LLGLAGDILKGHPDFALKTLLYEFKYLRERADSPEVFGYKCPLTAVYAGLD